LHVIKQSAPLADHFEQPSARMIVLAVRLEMLCEIGNPLGQDRDLDFWRTGIAGLGRIFLDELLLALSADRHRIIPCCLSFEEGRAGMSSSTVGSYARASGKPRPRLAAI